MPVRDAAATEIRPFAIRYSSGGTATMSRGTNPGQGAPATQRASRSATQTQQPSQRIPTPRRRADQASATTEDFDLQPVQRRTKPGEHHYTEHFVPEDNPYLHVAQQPAQRHHALFFVGVGMLILFLGWMLVLAVWTATTVNVLDHWNYGPSRMTSFSAVVGHNHDSVAHPTRFQAFEANGRIELIEFPAGDASKSRIYSSQLLKDAQGWQGDPKSAVVELSTEDVNGKVDLVGQVEAPAFTWNFQREEVTWTLLNTGAGFTSQAGGQ